MPRLLIAIVLFASCVSAQDARQFILASNRPSGVIELLDPTSLKTFGRIHVEHLQDSIGLVDVSASPDGSMIYLRGPSPTEPKVCCPLYSIDLATLQMNEVALMPGSDHVLVTVDGIAYRIEASVGVRDLMYRYLYRTPDGHWIFGVLSMRGGEFDFRGPAVDVYDLVRGNFHQLTPTGSTDISVFSGDGSGNRFYFFRSASNGESARLWAVSPETTSLGDGVAVEPFAQIAGCPLTGFAAERIVVVVSDLFIYPQYGASDDRRTACSNPAAGGAWRVDPSTGHLLQHVAPSLYFSVLIPDRTEPVLYGLSNVGPHSRTPPELVSIDARDGRTLQSRALDAGSWTISIASLRLAPMGDVRAIPAR